MSSVYKSPNTADIYINAWLNSSYRCLLSICLFKTLAINCTAQSQRRKHATGNHPVSHFLSRCPLCGCFCGAVVTAANRALHCSYQTYAVIPELQLRSDGDTRTETLLLNQTSGPSNSLPRWYTWVCLSIRAQQSYVLVRKGGERTPLCGQERELHQAAHACFQTVMTHQPHVACRRIIDTTDWTSCQIGDININHRSLNTSMKDPTAFMLVFWHFTLSFDVLAPTLVKWRFHYS